MLLSAPSSEYFSPGHTWRFGACCHAVHNQLNRQLLETARPIVSDMVSEPDAKDITVSTFPASFLSSWTKMAKSFSSRKNLSRPIKLDGLSLADSRPTFGIAALENGETVRVALIPFQQENQGRIFAVAIPTFGTNRVLDSFGRVALVAFSSKPPIDRRNISTIRREKPCTHQRADHACRADGQACHQPARILDAPAGVFPS